MPGMHAQPSPARHRGGCCSRLLAGTIVPTVAALVVFGFFAHEVARRALEDELGRRLGTAAAGAAATVLPEQLRAFGAGDEDSLTYANVRRRLEAARDRLGVRRVLAVTPELEARGDTARGARARRARLRAGRRPRRDRARARAARRRRRRCSSATTASPTSAPTRPSATPGDVAGPRRRRGQRRLPGGRWRRSAAR